MKHAGKLLMEKRKEFNKLNSYSFRTDKDEVIVNTGYICFAEVKREIQTVRGDITHFYLATGHKSNVPHFKKYLHFILTESIFKDCFITKRVCDASRYGVSMDVSKPLNQLQAGLIAVRRGWEFPQKTAAWAKLVEAGISPNLALVCTFWVQDTDKGLQFIKCGATSNHEVFNFKSFHQALLAIKSSLKEITPPLKQVKDFCMRVFETTQYPIEECKGLDWFSLQETNHYVKYLDFEKTVEKLKKIQKEYNV